MFSHRVVLRLNDNLRKTLAQFDVVICLAAVKCVLKGNCESEKSELSDHKHLHAKIVDHPVILSYCCVFEDYIYWADRATNSLNRCDKFSGEDRETLFIEATQINSLVIVHQAAQIQGENHCADNNCSHLCLPSQTSFVCRCDDRNLTYTTSCERDSSTVNQSCPEDYCPEDADCVFDSGRYVCK
ncbi:hypothetical protein AVEN_264425-1 [Araneus ventricosus]|uniref:Uncharacterized protein n=1 Tax=Araneus ventricosus TaxID=182803 RepID=A0A4Y2HTW3_ARAVE|nr:hypothetical protein AVEN_264425-1 [Araneus ventricosus]